MPTDSNIVQLKFFSHVINLDWGWLTLIEGAEPYSLWLHEYYVLLENVWILYGILEIDSSNNSILVNSRKINLSGPKHVNIDY